jgi:hypothetical protein
MSPTARTLARLRRLGFLAAVVERWVPGRNIRVDLFGLADVLGVHPHDKRVLLVQCTSAAHVGDRLRRVQARPELTALLAAGVAVEVWGWSFRAGCWHLRRVALRREDAAAFVVEAPPRRPCRGERQCGLFDGLAPPTELDSRPIL